MINEYLKENHLLHIKNIIIIYNSIDYHQVIIISII